MSRAQAFCAAVVLGSVTMAQLPQQMPLPAGSLHMDVTLGPGLRPAVAAV